MSRKSSARGAGGGGPVRQGGPGRTSTQGLASLPFFAFVKRGWVYRSGALSGVAAVGLVGGLCALTFAVAQRQGLVYDEAIYLQIAQRVVRTGCPIIAAGRGSVFGDSPPLVMYVAAAARMLGGDALLWLRGVQVAVWALPAYAAIFLLARRAFGTAGGLLAVVSFYTQPRFITEAAEVKLDVPVASLAILFLLGLSYVVEAESARTRAVATAVCAVCGALACMTKYQGILLPLLGVVVLLVGRWMGLRPVGTARSLPEVWLLLGAVVAAVAWFTLNSVCGGNLGATVLWNLRRVSFQTSETWFHRPLLVYWADLAGILGWVLVVGGIAGAAAWFTRLRQAPRVMLVVAWVAVTFAFCSAIGLRHERYFMPAVPALAVLVGALAAAETYDLPYLRHYPTATRVVRLGVVAVVLMSAAASLHAIITRLAAAPRVARSDAFYRQLAGAIRAAIPPDDRMMISRPQTAYLAERNYFLSEYAVDGKALLATLADSENRITLIVQDSDQMLHPDMPVGEQQQFWDYVHQHFAASQLVGVPALMHRRTGW